MTEQTEAAEVEARIVRCPEHGEPLAIEGRGPEGAGPYFHAWVCPACPNKRRCGSCGKVAPEAWSSGRCHVCYRVQARRMEQERREREQADYDRAIAAAEARGAERVLAAVEDARDQFIRVTDSRQGDLIVQPYNDAIRAARAAATGGGS